MTASTFMIRYDPVTNRAPPLGALVLVIEVNGDEKTNFLAKGNNRVDWAL